MQYGLLLMALVAVPAALFGMASLGTPHSRNPFEKQLPEERIRQAVLSGSTLDVDQLAEQTRSQPFTVRQVVRRMEREGAI
jgi:DNA-binding GntR family transcriptional regulator